MLVCVIFSYDFNREEYPFFDLDIIQMGLEDLDHIRSVTLEKDRDRKASIRVTVDIPSDDGGIPEDIEERLDSRNRILWLIVNLWLKRCQPEHFRALNFKWDGHIHKITSIPTSDKPYFMAESLSTGNHYDLTYLELMGILYKDANPGVEGAI